MSERTNPPPANWIDLTSDTVTRPDPEMRQAMASAIVGDDVYRKDPTVRQLEELGAECLGTEAALFVPTGTMGNQIALHVHGRPGSEVVGEASSHVFRYEMAAMAVLSGMIPRPIIGVGGRIDPEDLDRAINPHIDYMSSTAVLVLENTHNLAGGTVLDRSQLDLLLSVADRRQLAKHLDGARLFNAAVALGVPPATLVSGFDSVMVALSKGLGAPVGALVAGSLAFVEEARRARKMFGGGMRQAGIIAAAGVLALRRGFDHLAEDHAKARRVAEALARLPGVCCDPSATMTNIVVGQTENPAGALGRLRAAGILGIQLGPTMVRCVTHRDVSTIDLDRALDML